MNFPIYLAAKAIIKNHYSEKYNLTLDFGVGTNLINTSAYKETPLDDMTLPDHIFAGHTTAAFSAMAGIGIRFNSTFRKTPIECGYRFYYLGSGRLAIINSQVIDSLNTGNNYANALLCSVTF